MPGDFMDRIYLPFEAAEAPIHMQGIRSSVVGLPERTLPGRMVEASRDSCDYDG
jgi:hypothetical protein